MEGAATGRCANTIPRAPRGVRLSALPRWALVADAVATALFVLTLTVAITGGFVILVHRRGAALGPFRRAPFLLGCIIAAIRFYFVRQPSPLLTRLFRPRPPLPLDEPRLFEPARPFRGGNRLASSPGDRRMLRIHRAGHLAAGRAALRRLRPGRSAVLGLAVDVGDARVRPQPAQHLQRQPVLPGAPDAHLLGSGPDAGDPVRAARGDRPASRLVAYNIVFLSGGVFSGVSMYYLARAPTGRRDAAWIAAGDFRDAPVPSRAFRLPRAQMTMWMLVVLGLHRRWPGRLATACDRRRFRAQMVVGSYYDVLIPLFVRDRRSLWLAAGAR